MTKKATFPLTIKVPDIAINQRAEYVADMLHDEYNVENITVATVLAKLNFSADMIKQLTTYFQDVADSLDMYYVFNAYPTYNIEKKFAVEIKKAQAKRLEEQEQKDRAKPLTVLLNGKDRKQVMSQLQKLGLTVK